MNQLPPDQIREIPKWTRAYAGNRTLPVLVVMAVTLALFVASQRFFGATGEAWRAGDRLEFSLWFAAGLLCLTPAIPGVTRKAHRALSQSLYRTEGDVVAAGASCPPRTVQGAIVALFIGGVLAEVTLGSHIPDRYGQPVAALYVLPFLVMLARTSGLAGTLYPVLFGLHALLIVAGVPIWFEGRWAGLNILLPVGGYAILSLLAGHVYSRIALRRLRRLGTA